MNIDRYTVYKTKQKTEFGSNLDKTDPTLIKIILHKIHKNIYEKIDKWISEYKL